MKPGRRQNPTSGAKPRSTNKRKHGELVKRHEKKKGLGKKNPRVLI